MAGKPTAHKRIARRTVAQFLEPYSGAVQAIALRLRQHVFAAAPGALEQVDVPGKLLGYGYAATYKDTICVIMPLRSAVNLGFPRGAEMDDPRGLLEGTGKRARHVKVKDLKAADAPALKALLKAAVKYVKPR